MVPVLVKRCVHIMYSCAHMNKSNFRLLRKLCSVHMTVFEIVVSRNVDNWIQSLTSCILAQTTHPQIVGEYW